MCSPDFDPSILRNLLPSPSCIDRRNRDWSEILAQVIENRITHRKAEIPKVRPKVSPNPVRDRGYHERGAKLIGLRRILGWGIATDPVGIESLKKRSEPL